MSSYHLNDEPYTYIIVEPVYKTDGDTDHDKEIIKNPNFLFNCDVTYTTAYLDGGEEFENLDDIETHHYKTIEFDKNWVIGSDKAQMQFNAYHILEMIEVPCYSKIVKDLTEAIFDLKNHDVISVDEVNVDIHVVTVVPLTSDEDDDDEDDDNDVEVRPDVPPATDEAVNNHLEIVVAEDDEEHCVICMDKIEVVSDMEAARMPCKHMFHRPCVEEWLSRSGSCPAGQTKYKAGQAKDMAYNKAGQAKDMTYDKAYDKAGEAKVSKVSKAKDMVYDKADQAKDMAYDKMGSVYDKASQAKDFAYDKAGDRKDVIKMATDKSNEDKYTNGTYEQKRVQECEGHGIRKGSRC